MYLFLYFFSYNISLTENKECHIAVKPNKNSKQQALEVIGKNKKMLLTLKKFKFYSY